MSETRTKRRKSPALVKPRELRTWKWYAGQIDRGGSTPAPPDDVPYCLIQPGDLLRLVGEIERLRAVLDEIATDDELAGGYIRRTATEAL